MSTCPERKLIRNVIFLFFFVITKIVWTPILQNRISYQNSLPGGMSHLDNCSTNLSAELVSKVASRLPLLGEEVTIGNYCLSCCASGETQNTQFAAWIRVYKVSPAAKHLSLSWAPGCYSHSLCSVACILLFDILLAAILHLRCMFHSPFALIIVTLLNWILLYNIQGPFRACLPSRIHWQGALMS